MAKWWMGVAVAWCGLAGTAAAQNPYLPYQARPAVMPEPVPFSSSAPPSGYPSNGGQMPMSSQMSASGQTPVGVPPAGCVPGMPGEPETGHSLRGDTPNAWDQQPPYDPGSVYASLGFLSMTRQHLGHTPAAFLDTVAGADTGDPPPRNAPIFSDFHDINPRPNYGVKGLIGWHCGTSAIEVGGFYLAQNNSAKNSAAPNSLDALFFNPPLGFEGDAGMWLQDDIIRIFLRTAVGSAEANYRFWLGSDYSFSWSLGVRYLDIYERFGFYAGDDDLTVLDINGNPDPTRQALYQTTAHNHLVAPQLGFEWNREINCWLAFTLSAKGAWGANFLDVDTLLKRGDGFLGFSNHRSDTIFSHLYEAGFFLNLRLMDNMRLRAGYNLLWAVDVAEAAGQLDFNLANPAGRTNNHGSIFYHGPSVELSVLF
jgi:hypothetical protein